MFSGKGGVGKTTCAAAAAVYLSERGKRTLVFSTDPAHSLGDSLEVRPPDITGPYPVSAKLDLVQVQAEDVLIKLKREYRDELLDLLVTGTYLDEDDAEQLAGLTVPGVDELMGLKTVFDLLDQQAYDVCVWDTAPTGHTLRLLGLPAELDGWIKALAKIRWKYRAVMSQFAGRCLEEARNDLLLVMKKAVQRVGKIIKDPGQCQIIGVTIPESLAVEETKRLKASLRQYGIDLPKLVVNHIAPEASDCPFCRSRYRQQTKYLAELQQAFSDSRILQVPQFDGEIKGLVRLRKFAGFLFPSASRG